MKFLVTSIFIIVFNLTTYAQLNFQFSSQNSGRIKKAKELRKKARKLKSLYKTRLRNLKGKQNRTDSNIFAIDTAFLQENITNIKQDIANNIKTDTLENLLSPIENQLKSAELEKISSKTGQLDIMNNASSALEESGITRRMQEYNDMAKVDLANLNKLVQKNSLQQKLIEKAKNNIKNSKNFDIQENVSRYKEKLNSLKRKYSRVSNSNDLSSATRKNSLKGVNWKERLIFTGTLSLTEDAPKLNITFAPQVTYRLNKVWNVGFGAGHESKIWGKEFSTGNYALRAFTEYKLISGLSARSEYQKENQLSYHDGIEVRHWRSSIFIGISKTIPLVFGINGQLIMMYDFLHSSRSRIQSKPFSVRFGLNL